jgi:metal-dependent amidase/aminoacylase/carboxypeptidase family protein
MKFEREFGQVNEYVIETRRTLHRLAEISDEEVQTFAFIKNEIENMGFDYEIVSTT